MEIYLILYNPLSGNKTGEQGAHTIGALLEGSKVLYQNLLEINDYEAFYASIPEDQKIVLVGGDGTLNRFINLIDPDTLTRDIYYSGSGTGNDFLNDLGKKGLEKPFLLNPYLKNLPYIDVAGHTYRFLNGIGYGIDGFCCEEADKLKLKSDKPINYTSIAIKGLLYAFKPTNATITVDGKTRQFRKVWLAPTMHGRYFGGGMIPTPNQDRLNAENTLTVMTFFRLGNLPSLILFPQIFKGTLGKYKKHVFLTTGHDITVEFDRPTALQIDGETILGVTKYRAYTK